MPNSPRSPTESRLMGLEVAHIFNRYGEAYRQAHDASLSAAQRRAMGAIELCRTAALGGHIERCDNCEHERVAYNSCRNRHCPKCQSLSRAKWLAARQSELLETPYFHVVFTLPDEVAVIAYQNKATVYDILFRAAAQALSAIAADPSHLGAEIGFVCVLHTWGQNLLITRTCTAWFPVAASRPEAIDGWLAGLVSSFPSRFCRACFVACSCTISKPRSPPGDSISSLRFNPLRNGARSAAISLLPGTPNGWSMPSRHSPGRAKSSPILADIPIASPSRTTGSWRPTMARSAFAGRTIDGETGTAS